MDHFRAESWRYAWKNIFAIEQGVSISIFNYSKKHHYNQQPSHCSFSNYLIISYFYFCLVKSLIFFLK